MRPEKTNKQTNKQTSNAIITQAYHWWRNQRLHNESCSHGVPVTSWKLPGKARIAWDFSTLSLRWIRVLKLILKTMISWWLWQAANFSTKNLKKKKPAMNSNNRRILIARGVASFSTSCRPGRLSFPYILKLARMTSMHWPHQHFELF